MSIPLLVKKVDSVLLESWVIDPTSSVHSTTGMDPNTGTPTSGHRRHAVTPETDVKTMLVDGGLIHVRLMPGFKKGKHNN